MKELSYKYVWKFTRGLQHSLSPYELVIYAIDK